MSRDEALQFKNRIVDLCREKNVWNEVTLVNRPDLKAIEMKLSIKVTEDK